MRFGPYLEEAIAKAELSQRAFAKKVRSHQQAIHEVIKGKRGPPLARLEVWAEALGSVVDRELFLELGRLEHCPPEIRDLVNRLRGRSAD